MTVGDVGCDTTQLAPLEPQVGQSSGFATVVTGMVLPCSGKVFGWNINASNPGQIKIGLLRNASSFFNSTVRKVMPLQHSIIQFEKTFHVVLEEFQATTGLNIFHSKLQPTFSNDDLILFIAPVSTMQSCTGSSSNSSSIHTVMLDCLGAIPQQLLHVHGVIPSSKKFNVMAILQGIYLFIATALQTCWCRVLSDSYGRTQVHFQYQGVEISMTFRAYTLYNSH